MAIIVALGTSWRNSSSRFAPNTPVMKTAPVTLLPRPIEAGNEAVPDRIAPAREDDGNGAGFRLGGDRRNVVCDYHGHWQSATNRPPGPAARSVMAVCRAIFDRDVLALDKADFL